MPVWYGNCSKNEKHFDTSFLSCKATEKRYYYIAQRGMAKEFVFDCGEVLLAVFRIWAIETYETM